MISVVSFQLILFHVVCLKIFIVYNERAEYIILNIQKNTLRR